jgi:hypothetical protein
VIRLVRQAVALRTTHLARWKVANPFTNPAALEHTITTVIALNIYAESGTAREVTADRPASKQLSCATA